MINPIVIVLVGLLVVLIAQNILLSRCIVKKNEKYAKLELAYGIPLIEAAFASYKTKEMIENSYREFITAPKSDVLPKTPETCPNCGSKISGGATHPGEDMVPDARVFYICGASISLRNWGSKEESPHIMLKNCKDLKEPVIKYPILFGKLVKIHVDRSLESFRPTPWPLRDNGYTDKRFKAKAGTPIRDDNPMAVKECDKR